MAVRNYHTGGKLFNLVAATENAGGIPLTIQVAQDRSGDEEFTWKFGALAEGMNPVRLRALIISPDGRTLIRDSVETDPQNAANAGRKLGERHASSSGSFIPASTTSATRL